jgi:pyridoxine 4-dehydrogenase
VLLPASMKLLGDWNWYLPSWLEWLPRFDTSDVGARDGPDSSLRLGFVKSCGPGARRTWRVSAAAPVASSGMATIRLADTDVPRIGLGTNRLRNTAENVAFVKEAVAAGVRFIDTAHVYTGGESEATIGAALSPIPDDCIVATKGGRHGASPDVVRAQIDESLKRLRTDSIALYYLHFVDPETPIEESLGAIKEYRDSGKIRHVGISNVAVDEIERARTVVPIAAVQNRYNLAEREHAEVVDYCAAEGIVFVPYFPLRGDGGSAVAEVAERHGATPAQIRLAWLLKRSPTMLPIPGTLSLDHLKDNLAAQDVELAEDEFRALQG